MRSFARLIVAAVGLVCSVLGAGPAAAQEPHRVTRRPAELFTAYVRERQALANKTNASVDLAMVLTHPSEYPRGDLEWLLRELESFALSGQPDWLRAEAVLQLAVPGSTRAVRPVAGSYARLDRVYRRSNDPLVKTSVVTAMGTLTERREAIAFLERVARHEAGTFPSAGKALASLLTMGDEGRVVLKRLHETGAVRDPAAKRDLAVLAQRDFRIPEARQ